MNRALWVAKTGLEAQQTRLSTISNNMANVSTTGFKRDRAVFEDLLYQNVRQVGAQNTQDTQLPSGLNLGTGVNIVGTQKIHTQGNLVQTENALDMAIDGRGFMRVLLPDGNIGYTRDGSFQLNNEGQLVTSSGHPVQPPINVPEGAQSITIGEDGTVTAVTGDNQAQNLGNLQVADFVNPAGLQAIGQNLYLESAASGAPQTGVPGLDGRGSLLQGMLETSNVKTVEEMVNMIETQRSFEMNSKAVSTADQMLQNLNQNT